MDSQASASSPAKMVTFCTAVIVGSMLCFLHPLFQIVTRRWSFRFIASFMDDTIIAAIMFLFAIGVGVTHLLGLARRRAASIAAITSVATLAFVSCSGLVLPVSSEMFLLIMYTGIMIDLLSITITTFCLLEPLAMASVLVHGTLPCARYKTVSIIGGIAIGAITGGAGVWLGSMSLFWLFVTWTLFSVAGAALIARSLRSPLVQTPRIISKAGIKAEARGFFSRIFSASGVTIPGIFLLAIAGGSLNNELGNPDTAYFTVIGPASIAIVAMVAMSGLFNFNMKGSKFDNSTSQRRFSALQLLAVLSCIAIPAIILRLVDITTGIMLEPGALDLAAVSWIIVAGFFGAMLFVFSSYRVVEVLSKSRLPGWVLGFGLGVFWLVITPAQVFASELGYLYFNTSCSWIFDLVMAGCAIGYVILGLVAFQNLDKY